MKSSDTFAKNKPRFSIARLKHSGEKFEIIVDPNKALAFRNKTLKDVNDVLRYAKIFSDANKSLIPSEDSIENIFGTKDPIKVAEKILLDGEIQLTAEYRDSLRVAKQKQLIQLIHRNAVDPRTKLPHPITRIENAFNEAKVKIDEYKTAEDQLDEVLKKLRPIIPVQFETRQLQLVIPSQFASKSIPTLKNFAQVIKQSWQSDGTLFAIIKLPAGLQQDLVELLNKITKGDIDIKILEGK